MRRTFRPHITRPNDFDVFWHSTRLQLERLDPLVHRRPLSPREAPEGIAGERISFVSLGHVRISAYFLYWRDDKPRPLVIYSHGYGSACEPRWDWATRGLNLLGVDIRGFGNSRDAVPEVSRWGYVITGIDTPETSVLRLAICDYMQAARVGRSLCEGRISRTVFHGVSFAGGLAMMSEAVLGVADVLVVGVPTFGWAEGRHFFVKSGSGAEINRYLARHLEHIEDVMLVLSYFDVINFAEKIRCATLLGVGLQDIVVPAKTVYSIANHLPGPHEIMEFPVSHSDHPEEQLWKGFEQAWLDLALHGIHVDFGRRGK